MTVNEIESEILSLAHESSDVGLANEMLKLVTMLKALDSHRGVPRKDLQEGFSDQAEEVRRTLKKLARSLGDESGKWRKALLKLVKQGVISMSVAETDPELLEEIRALALELEASQPGAGNMTKGVSA